MKAENFDVVVVGAGPGGYVAAIRAAQLGLRTAIVEKSELGGICLNWGCIPTKAMLRSADVLRLMRQAVQFGIKAAEPEPDLQAIVARSRKVATQLQRGVGQLMKKNGITVINGQARLAGKERLAVTSKDTETLIAAKHIVLATGARARTLPGLDANPDSVWYYREALTPPRLPKSMLVVGAGAIGIEFASFYHALGVQVHVVEMADRVLPLEDAEVSEYVGQSLRKQGMTLHLGCGITGQRKYAGGWKIKLGGPGDKELDVEVILVAAGIVGNVEGLGLEGTAVKVENSHIVTDSYGATGESGVYAIGDVAGAPWLAHKASHEAMICIEKIAGLTPEPIAANRVPACTYSHPQVAHVGLTEQQARDAGRPVRVGKFPFSANGKAIALGATDGFVKVVFDADSGELLGAHMVGDEVTEMIQGYVVATELETTEAELMQSIFPHPTQSEAMHEAVLSAYGRGLHY
ncbi:dihydrolipoyl dehydrogenase [Pollutimonas harenae]|uniref:Dihydrolipoyl dehydrogenase n=1 Tax=Pollutimonas harenae TaxID=657015 RepID=A0A853H0A7_9BURK|nr:dihydrolipoyl dehydrogenase [Pollutimonas harenae]NYT84715.1 dihydrolipoyl dehydrogenase [Pollutimonas harenae]TEA72883.1 dihydrolipoyl dehydrogenase [Pollutimonas harenae]